MKHSVLFGFALAAVLFAWMAPCVSPPAFGQAASTQAPHIGEGGLPQFEKDPAWPKVPAKWKMGFGSAVAIDADDHVWVLSRPHTLPKTQSAMAAPPVMEFDNEGNFIQGWGGESGPGYQWPSNEHAITVDYKGFVWIMGNADGASNSPAHLPTPVVYILNRKTLEVLGSFVTGSAQDHPPGHQIAADHKGNVYVVQAELTGADGSSGGTGAYEFAFKGYSPVSKCCQGEGIHALN